MIYMWIKKLTTKIYMLDYVGTLTVFCISSFFSLMMLKKEKQIPVSLLEFKCAVISISNLL